MRCLDMLGMTPEASFHWVSVMKSALVYFALIPGIFFALYRRGGGDLAAAIMRGILVFPAVAVVALLAQKVHPMGGLACCLAVSAYGWWRHVASGHRLKDSWVYALIWPATLLPITMFDALNYHLRIPRGIHRIGLSVVDGTTCHSQEINVLHWFLSAFGFDERLMNTAAIAIQAGCLVLILRLFSRYAPHPWIWKCAMLGMPLTVQLSQEAWLDMSCALMLAVFYLRCIKGRHGIMEAAFFGFMFHFKWPLFLMACPLLGLLPLKQWLNVRWMGVASLPILSTLAVIWVLTGYPFNPYIFCLPIHPEFHETLVATKQVLDDAMHQGRWNIPGQLNAIFYMTCPVLLPCCVFLFRTRRVALVFAATLLIWVVLCPQVRFLMTLIPAMFLAASLNIRSRWDMWGVGLLSIFLLPWRGVKEEFRFWQRHPPTRILTLSDPHPFSAYIAPDEKYYHEDDWGWSLPGHAVSGNVIQFRWVYSEPWLDQMRDSGIRHVITCEGYEEFMLTFGTEASPYRKVFARWDELRRQRLAEVVAMCDLVARHGNLSLYRIPSP